MPATRNIYHGRQQGQQIHGPAQVQGRTSRRLENQVPIAYDDEGWEVSLGRNTLQDYCLSRGPQSPLPLPLSLLASSQPRIPKEKRKHRRSPTTRPPPPPSPESHRPSPIDSILGAVLSINDINATRVGHKAQLPVEDSPPSEPATPTSSFAPTPCHSTFSLPPTPSSAATTPEPVATPATKKMGSASRKHNPYPRKASPTPDHVPRPRNAFIIFRSAFNAENHNDDRTNQNEISKMAGKVWKSLSPEEKAPFIEQARIEKEEHNRRYPNYRYAPGGKTNSKKASARGAGATIAKSAGRRTPSAKGKKSRAAAAEYTDSEDSEMGDDYSEEFSSRLSVPPLPVGRSLRPRSTAPRYSSSVVADTPSPTPSASHSLSSPASFASEPVTEDESEEGFVETENIPPITLSPNEPPSSTPDFTHTSSGMEGFDRSAIPAFSNTYFRLPGVKAQAQATINDTFWGSTTIPAADAFTPTLEGTPSLSPIMLPQDLRTLDGAEPSFLYSLPPIGFDEFSHNPWSYPQLGEYGYCNDILDS